MAGAAVPNAGDIGDDDVTNAEQETNLENLSEALRRTLGVGSVSIPVTTISAGSIAPTLGIVLVDTEGMTSSDNLDHIDASAYLDGSIILLASASSGLRTVTVRNTQGGAGQIILNTAVGGGGAANFPLSNFWSWLLIRSVSGQWVEVARSYGSNAASSRAFLNLGTAATLDNGAVNAATLQGNPASAFLPVAGTAANSTLFAGLAAAAFLRADIASLQTIAGSLRANSGRLEVAVASAAGAPFVEWRANNIPRAQAFYDGTTATMTWRLLAVDGTTVVGGFRVRPGEVPEWWNAGSSAWISLFTLSSPSPWLDRIRWDKLDGVTQYTGTGNFVLHSDSAPVLPGSGGTRLYRIQAGIRGIRVGSSGPSFRARLHVGNNGNDTDTMVAESPIVTVNPSPQPNDPRNAIIDDEFECPTGSEITLVLTKTNGANIDVLPSIASTYTVEKITYLRVEQIG